VPCRLLRAIGSLCGTLVCCSGLSELTINIEKDYLTLCRCYVESA